MDHHPLMPRILRSVGVFRVAMAVIGAGFFVRGTLGAGHTPPLLLIVTQAVLIATAALGGIGWVILRDWGRKVLLVPSLYSILQAATVVLMGIFPTGPYLWPLLLGLLVALATIVLILLPAARCELPSWSDEANRDAFRALGIVSAAAGAGLGILLVWISRDVEGMAMAVFTAPTVFLALAGGAGMIFYKNWGRWLLMTLWAGHALLSGLGPVFDHALRSELWRIPLTGAMSLALRSDSPQLYVTNLVFLMSLALMVAAWLPKALSPAPAS